MASNPPPNAKNNSSQTPQARPYSDRRYGRSAPSRNTMNYQSMIEHFHKCRIEEPAAPPPQPYSQSSSSSQDLAVDYGPVYQQPPFPYIHQPGEIAMAPPPPSEPKINELSPEEQKFRALQKKYAAVLPKSREYSQEASKYDDNGHNQTQTPSRHWQERILDYLDQCTAPGGSTTPNRPKMECPTLDSTATDPWATCGENNIDRHNRLTLLSQQNEANEKFCKICGVYFATIEELATHLSAATSHLRLLCIVLDYFDLL